MTDPERPKINVESLGNPIKSAVVGIVPADEQEVCVDDLMSAGFTFDTVDILFGEEGRAILDIDGRHHGVKKRVLHVLQNLLGSSGNDTAAYDKALVDGDYVIGVGVDGQEELQRAVQILRDHGGDRLNYFDGGTEVQL